MTPVIIVSTFPSKQSVTSIAKKLVKQKLAACVNITNISSIYAWKGKIENQSEYLALFKTSKKNQSKLKKELQNFIHMIFQKLRKSMLILLINHI